MKRSFSTALATIAIAPLLSNVAASSGGDVPVNDPTLDFGGGTTQSETSVAIAGNVVCVTFNDTGAGLFGRTGFAGGTGFAFSTDGGATFTDGGLFVASIADPTVVYSARDDAFYYLAVGQIDTGLRLKRPNSRERRLRRQLPRNRRLRQPRIFS